jgi:hypothetical protein
MPPGPYAKRAAQGTRLASIKPVLDVSPLEEASRGGGRTTATTAAPAPNLSLYLHRIAKGDGLDGPGVVVLNVDSAADVEVTLQNLLASQSASAPDGLPCALPPRRPARGPPRPDSLYRRARRRRSAAWRAPLRVSAQPVHSSGWGLQPRLSDATRPPGRSAGTRLGTGCRGGQSKMGAQGFKGKGRPAGGGPASPPKAKFAKKGGAPWEARELRRRPPDPSRPPDRRPVPVDGRGGLERI